MQIDGNSLTARVLMLLGERYPITLPEVAIALHARETTVAHEIKRLVARGLVITETVGGRTYVTLTGGGITLLGLPAKESARLRERRLPPAPPRDEHDPAFG